MMKKVLFNIIVAIILGSTANANEGDCRQLSNIIHVDFSPTGSKKRKRREDQAHPATKEQRMSLMHDIGVTGFLVSISKERFASFLIDHFAESQTDYNLTSFHLLEAISHQQTGKNLKAKYSTTIVNSYGSNDRIILIFSLDILNGSQGWSIASKQNFLYPDRAHFVTRESTHEQMTRAFRRLVHGNFVLKLEAGISYDSVQEVWVHPDNAESIKRYLWERAKTLPRRDQSIFNRMISEIKAHRSMPEINTMMAQNN